MFMVPNPIEANRDHAPDHIALIAQLHLLQEVTSQQPSKCSLVYDFKDPFDTHEEAWQ